MNMSFEYIENDGTRTIIRPAVGAQSAVLLSMASDDDYNDALIPNADIPTVAAELLKAAGQESVIMPKSELPTYGVEVDCLTFTAPDGHKSVVGLDWTPERLRHLAMARLATAEYIESKSAREAAVEAEAEAAEKKLQERRDALATEFSTYATPYDRVSRTARAAINYIITLEDGK